jgi:hypothetical protein
MRHRFARRDHGELRHAVEHCCLPVVEMSTRIKFFDLGDDLLAQLVGRDEGGLGNPADPALKARPIRGRRLSDRRDDAPPGNDNAVRHLRSAADQLRDRGNDVAYGLEFGPRVVGIIGNLDIEFFFKIENHLYRVE